MQEAGLSLRGEISWVCGALFLRLPPGEPDRIDGMERPEGTVAFGEATDRGIRRRGKFDWDCMPVIRAPCEAVSDCMSAGAVRNLKVGARSVRTVTNRMAPGVQAVRT